MIVKKAWPLDSSPPFASTAMMSKTLSWPVAIGLISGENVKATVSPD